MPTPDRGPSLLSPIGPSLSPGLSSPSNYSTTRSNASVTKEIAAAIAKDPGVRIFKAVCETDHVSLYHPVPQISRIATSSTRSLIVSSLLGFSYYARSTSLQPEFYQQLLNHGWRRSGTLLYKPDQIAACCPHYTIRLDTHSFHASKDQRQTLNRFSRYVLGDHHIKETARLHPKSRDQAKKRDTDFDLLERVHESERDYLKASPEPAHLLKVTLEPENYTEEKYALFENYQRIVHHEPPYRISKSGFRNFLCKSPLPRSKETIDGKERKLGSYHQCYRLDGKLVAVGVLDLLPQCVSAVYFMYHESVHPHGFGKLGALREIALAKEDGYKWWYAGFYIHSCVKMRYKADYSPQYMLDPDTYDWDLLDDKLKKMLDEKTFVSLSRERAKGGAASLPSQNQTTSDNQSSSGRADIVETNSVTEMEVDEDDDPPVPNPNAPLWEREAPGILTKNQLLMDIDLDKVKIQINREIFEAGMLVRWDSSDMDDPHSIKGIIAELVSAVGLGIGKEMVLTFE